MISGQLDMQVLNLLIENERFPYLLNMIRFYFDSSITEGVMTTNRIMDRATDSLMQFKYSLPKRQRHLQTASASRC